MNACSLSRLYKGAVLNTKHAAPSVARMGEASRLFRFFVVGGSLKVRPFAAQQSSPLFGLRFLGRNAAQPRLTNLFSRFWRTSVIAPKSRMTVGHMLLLRQTFKIFCSVIGLAFVNVMNVLFGAKRLQPASRHNTMRKSSSAQHGIAIWPCNGGVRLELSENFSAARNSVQVVKKSIFDTVYFYAQHAVPLGG
jgi:hypothetical protein